MKKIVVTLLMFTLFVSTVFSPVASAKKAEDNSKSFMNQMFKEAKNLEDSSTQSTDIIDDNGAVIGKTVTDFNRKVEKNNKDGIVTITLNTETHNEINGQIDDKVYDTQVISYTINGSVFLNGEKVSQNMLNAQVNTNQSSEPIVTTALASGGLSYLTHYKETSTDKYTLKAYKEPTNAFLDDGSGTPRTKTNVSYGTKVVDFKQLAKNVSGYRSDILAASATLVAAGFSALYWWTIIALLGAAGAVGIAAYQIYVASTSAQADMKEAYDLLG